MGRRVRTTFREILAKKGLVEAMAAHSPLSAMLAAEAGFDAIWASGLRALGDVWPARCQPGVDDPASRHDAGDGRALGLPVVADIDTGFGNAINVLYAVEQYERAGAAAS